MEARCQARRGIGTAAIAVVVVVIIAAGAASAFFIQNGISGGGTTTTSTSSTTSSSLSSVTLTYTSFASSSTNGLLLSLSLNSSSLANGRGVAATIRETNTLSTSLNISTAADWPTSGLSIGPCGTLNDPIGISILQGNYGLTNASSGTPLSLYSPGTYACPAIFAIQSYFFQPMSDNATFYGSCTPNPACFNETVSATVSVSGYYLGSNFTSFQAGVYTVLAGDEWGDIAVSHFSVS